MMMKPEKFSLRKRLLSFRYAIEGLKHVMLREHNMRVHFFAMLCVIALGIFFDISLFEWIAILFAIGFVLVSEIFNSVIENIANFVSPDKHHAIKSIKDMSAAAVLISALTALIVGIVIFAPKIINLLG